jgi:hypothetical protein
MDEEDHKPAAKRLKRQVLASNDVTVDPTDNLEDINSGILNSEVSVIKDQGPSEG